MSAPSCGNTASVDAALASVRLEQLQQQLADTHAQLERTRPVEHRRHRARYIALVTTAAVVVTMGALVAAAPAAKGTTVKAPFRVVDGRGKLVLSINTNEDGNYLALFDENENEAVSATADSTGGYLYATTADLKWTVALDVDRSTPFFKIVAGDDLEAEPTPDDRVSFDVTDGKPYVRLKANTGHGVIQLSEDAFAGGRLEVAKANGDILAVAGVSKDAIGIVEAHPLGNPMGSFIVGVTPKK